MSYFITHAAKVTSIITGSSSQEAGATPSPTNPVDIVSTVKYTRDGTIVELRSLGSLADSYNPATGVITRNVGAVYLRGNENWTVSTNYSDVAQVNVGRQVDGTVMCTHFKGRASSGNISTVSGQEDAGCIKGETGSSGRVFANMLHVDSDVTAFKEWLGEQSSQGSPVLVLYPLYEAVEEHVGQLYSETAVYGDIKKPRKYVEASSDDYPETLKGWGLLELDGSENWSAHATYPVFTSPAPSKSELKADTPPCVCDGLKGISPSKGASQVQNKEIKVGYYSTSSSRTMYLRNDDCSTVEEFKEYLSNNNLRVLYPLSVSDNSVWTFVKNVEDNSFGYYNEETDEYVKAYDTTGTVIGNLYAHYMLSHGNS